MRHDAGHAPGIAGVLADNGIAISMSGCGAASNMRGVSEGLRRRRRSARVDQPLSQIL
jgi:hypothetical protein